MLTCDDYITPASLDEAFDAMAEHRGHYRIVAGATDTLPWAREGRAGDVHIPVLIDVTKIRELRDTSVGDQRVRLGAATPIQRFLDDKNLARSLPAMPRCAVWFADEQIRAQATIGGNIVNASPAADATPCLIAHEADVEVARKSGGKVVRRRMKLDRFVTGPNRTALEEGELLLAIECDEVSRKLAIAARWSFPWSALPLWSSWTQRVGKSRMCVYRLRGSVQSRCVSMMLRISCAADL